MLNRFSCCRITAITGLDPHAQVVIIFLPSVVLNLEKDSVEQHCFVAIHQLWKDTVVLVDQSEAFTGSCFPVAFHQLIFCNAHVRTSIFFLGGVRVGRNQPLRVGEKQLISVG